MIEPRIQLSSAQRRVNPGERLGRGKRHWSSFQGKVTSLSRIKVSVRGSGDSYINSEKEQMLVRGMNPRMAKHL